LPLSGIPLGTAPLGTGPLDTGPLDGSPWAHPAQAQISRKTSAWAGTVNASSPRSAKAGPHRPGRCTASFSASRSTWPTGSPRPAVRLARPAVRLARPAAVRLAPAMIADPGQHEALVHHAQPPVQADRVPLPESLVLDPRHDRRGGVERGQPSLDRLQVVLVH